MRLLGLGKYSSTTVTAKEDIKQEKLDEYINMLNNEYKLVLKTTDDYKLIEQIKGDLSEEEIELKLSLYK